MADKIDAGAILIEEGALLPESLGLESERCLNGWRRVKNLDGSGLDGRVREAGWTFFFLAGEIKASVFGFDLEKTTQRAIARLLTSLKAGKSNCLEITQVVSKRFLGMPYVSVSAHARHIQKSMYLHRANLPAV